MKRSIKEVIGIDSANAYKPVFLTKIQRQELALNRNRDQISDNRLRRDQIGDFITDTEYANVDRIKDRERDRDRDRHRDRNRDRRERDHKPDRRTLDRNRNRRERDREPDRRIRDCNRDRRERDREPVLRIREEAKAREKKRIERLFEREQDKQLDAMKEFLCRESTKPKKRVIKPSEKFRYSFHWENTEDTSGDTYALCQNPHEARILFGAGMDRIDQKKQAAKHEKDTRRKKDDKHWSEKRLEEMSERDWRIFKEDFNISYKGTKFPLPMRNWEESKLSSELLRAVERAGYKKPSPIQMAAIPLGLQQRDVIGIAETGSGKTAAFVLPMLAYIARLPPMSEDNEREGPYAVVIAPTRELALQIEEETAKFARYLGFRVTSIVGGQCIEKQGLKITQGCEIVIATPGRLIDCLERRYVVLNQCNYVVLDEADRMIDLGFEPQVADVLDVMPSSNLKPENEEEELDEKKIYRTTYMFSATMSPGLERLARKYLRNPVVVTTVTEGKTTDTITQQVIMMEESEKLFRLQKLLDELGDKTAIVFVNTKKNVDFVAKNLDNAGYRVTTIHGGKSQDQREISLGGFKEKRYNVLVATDVVGRGIDISDVAHVINYDMPKDIETYTHRIGRTGRAGKSGVATSFLTLQDTEAFDDLKQMLVLSNSVVPPELARASGFKPGPVPDRRPRHSDTIHRN